MSKNETSVIQTAGVTKIFKDFWHRQRVVAVDHLDLDVHREEVFGLLGPNGSGKTTTIKMLLGLLYPTRGRIRVLGRAPTDVAVKSRIGYLPEESYLYQFLNARETLDYYGRLFQLPRQQRRRRVEQLLEMTGLTREARRRVGEYSKGMARRIGLAQALINDPDLLILDEPTAGLDPLGTREIKDLIVFLNREKRKTILLCSHLLADVEDVCQRVTVLYGGRQQALGDIRDLLRQQDLTQITTERLGAETVEKIRRLVEESESKQVLEVTAPSDKLETFFLRIVREAQELRQATSGATGGGRIAAFLSEGQEGESLVETLIAAAEAPASEEEEAAPTIPVMEEEPAVDVLEELVADHSSRSPSADEDRSSPDSAGPSVSHLERPSLPDESTSTEVDRGLIDDLIKGADRETDQPKE